MTHNNYDYYNNLDDPRNDIGFINEVKVILRQLNITGNINSIKDFDTLMKFIRELMTKHNNLKSVITTPLIKSEIYDEQHIKWKNDELIQKLIDRCLEKNDKGKHKFMLVVSHLLPILVKKSYINLVENLAIQLNYRKIPENWCENLREDNKFISIRENLWGYRFPSSSSNELPSSIFNRFEKESRHYATLCYVPLPGLCTFPEDTSCCSILFPRGKSPFVQIVMSSKDEIFEDGHAYSKMIESPFFQAIVKFKWHTFARRHFLIFYFLIFTLFSLLIVSTIVDLNKHMEIINSNKDYTNKITKAATKSYIAAVTMIANLNDATNTFINNVTIAEAAKSNIEVITRVIKNVAASEIYNVNIISEINKAAIEAVDNEEINDTIFTAAINDTTIATINNNYVSEINKAISTIDTTTIIRLFIIFKINGIANRVLRVSATYVIIAGIFMVLMTGIIKLSPESFKSERNYYLKHGYDYISIFQASSIFILGLCLVGLLSLFRNIGIFAYIMLHICRKAKWLLFLLGILLLDVSYATMYIFTMTVPDFDNEKKMYKENTYDNYIKSTDNVWLGVLNVSYDYMYPWDSRFFVSIMRFTFSFFAAIVTMNLLIAFVNNVYEDVYKREYIEWTMVRARAIAYIELTCSVPNNYTFLSFFFIDRKNKDYFPPTIIYEAKTEEVKKHNELHNFKK